MYSNFKCFMLEYRAIKGCDAMSHLKKDFKYHKLFDNKYAEQSYIAYLSKNKRKYVMNTSDFVERYIVITIDFIFRVNNAICRRGLEKNNILDIRELYDKKYVGDYHYWALDVSIKQLFKKVDVSDVDNDFKQEIYDMLKTIVEWEDKFESYYKEFKEVIFNFVKVIDDKHYDWCVGENIIYNRSARDNVVKSFYCITLGDDGYKRFRKSYLDKVYVEAKDRKILLEQVSDMLVIVADVYNELINKHFESANQVLKDYIEEHKAMIGCKDIYYAKVYVELSQVLKLLDNNKHTEAIKQIGAIIQSENNKYKKDVVLFEKVAIDEEAIEDGQYIEL